MEIPSELVAQYEALAAKLVVKGGVHGIYLNRYGELDSFESSRAEWESPNWHDAATIRVGDPNWLVGVVGIQETGPSTERLIEAWQTRQDFYSEREKEYGPSAWPQR